MLKTTAFVFNLAFVETSLDNISGFYEYHSQATHRCMEIKERKEREREKEREIERDSGSERHTERIIERERMRF